MQFVKEFCFLKHYLKMGKDFFLDFFEAQMRWKQQKEGVELEKNLKFGSVCFSLLQFEVWGQKLDSIEFEIWKLDSTRVRGKVVRTHV